MKALGQYTVNISKHNFDMLYSTFDKGEKIPEGIYFMVNPKQYNKRTGVILQNKFIEDIFIISNNQ